ncbi:peptidase M16 [Bacteroidales bacterium]|nr:peptidase M16 [Bacteroidales bacterium]
MIKKLFFIVCLSISSISFAQKIEFTEYKLDNGLNVILHQDDSAPLVNVSVMYHVGGKNDMNGKTGFAHFFEHLLFEGSENIERGTFFKLVSNAGGKLNAYTSNDVTYYYEVLPSNELATGLWMESERMMHPKIDQIGVDTQRGVIKEEMKQTRDNRPYGKLWDSMLSSMFKEHNYKGGVIGNPEDLDKVTLEDVEFFFNTYYVPNNATLVVAGDIDINKTKKMVQDYFGPIKRGAEVKPYSIKETKELGLVVDTVYDANIQVPALIQAFRGPETGTKDSYALQMLCDVLAGGRSSRLIKKMVDEKKSALQVSSMNQSLEDYSLVMTFALPNMGNSLDDLKADIDEEIKALQDNLMEESEYQKLMKKYEVSSVDKMSGVENISTQLAYAYTFRKNTNTVNEELAVIRSISREDIQKVAREYLKSDSQVILYYLPKVN